VLPMSQLSVIVPIHNAGRKLHQCIRSIQAQTYQDWNLLLIDDGSTDASLRICEAYSKCDSRIQVYSQPQSGSIAARRKGIELSQSPYISFVDADDWIDPSMLERLFTASASSGADIAVCDMYRSMNSKGWIKKGNVSVYLREEKIYTGDEIRTEIVPAFLHGHPFPVQFHGKLYKRELLLSSGTYTSRIRFFGDDLFYNLEMFLKAHTIHLLPDRLYYYRVGGFTSRYMPDLFTDMVSGYQIQQEVIERYYPVEKSKHDFGTKVMLLNTLRTCLKNLFASSFPKSERLQLIQQYCENPDVRECILDESAAGYFSPTYIHAIQHSDSRFLYRIGKMDYLRSLPKKILVNAATTISF
jgi:glycosyltransferase involved in cell wall biosynthesis